MKRTIFIILCFLVFTSGTALASDRLGQPVPAEEIVTQNGLEWVWASLCSGGCGTSHPSNAPGGWRFATSEELAQVPPLSAFEVEGGPSPLPDQCGGGSFPAECRCASAWFDTFHHHCDPLNYRQGLITSEPNGSFWETFYVRDGNTAPDADAGTDQTILIGNTVTLDGSASSDADSDPLTFSWSLTTVPTGSAATLSDPTAVGPTFFVDLAGTYVAQLIVNDGTVDSTADTVNVFGNTPPTCNGNPSGLALVGMAIDTPIQFSVEGIDPDGDLLRVTSTPLPGDPPNQATLTPVAGTTQASPFTANFDWTPAAVDPETVTITMDDLRGGSCSQTFIITPGFRGFVSAFSRDQCSVFKRGGSARLLFDEFGKIRSLTEDITFFDNGNCDGAGRPGSPSDPGNIICSQSQFSPGVCARGTQNSPYILKMFINGVGAVSTCYDFDGLPADCNLGAGATCIDSSQCTSGVCSGSAETPGVCVGN